MARVFPIVVRLGAWNSELRYKRVLFMCDNESVVHVINTQTAKDTWDERCLGYCAQRFLFASEEHYPFSLGNAIFHELRTC